MNDFTILSGIVGIFLEFFGDFDFFGKILGIGLVIKVAICSIAKPIGASFQLVGNVSIVIFFIVLLCVLL